jgi:hypothetical protein
MHDLIPAGQMLPGTLSDAEIDATMAFAEAEKAASTRAAYTPATGVTSPPGVPPGAPQALPAHVGIVAAYLSGLADSGRKASTIGRRAAAIGYRHKMAGHEPPTNQEGVRAVLRGIRRTLGAAREGKAPATADVLKQILALCPDTRCWRWASPARSAAPSWWRCRWRILPRRRTACAVAIRRRKTDQEGRGPRWPSCAAVASVRSRPCSCGSPLPSFPPARCSAPC